MMFSGLCLKPSTKNEYHSKEITNSNFRSCRPGCVLAGRSVAQPTAINTTISLTDPSTGEGIIPSMLDGNPTTDTVYVGRITNGVNPEVLAVMHVVKCDKLLRACLDDVMLQANRTHFIDRFAHRV